uniref:Uncharacterized protein n=1 Tax=Arundo donax TaxID=35708 RepID=A0A0A9GA16_ARUDO
MLKLSSKTPAIHQ